MILTPPRYGSISKCQQHAKSVAFERLPLTDIDEERRAQKQHRVDALFEFLGFAANGADRLEAPLRDHRYQYRGKALAGARLWCIDGTQWDIAKDRPHHRQPMISTFHRISQTAPPCKHLRAATRPPDCG